MRKCNGGRKSSNLPTGSGTRKINTNGYSGNTPHSTRKQSRRLRPVRGGGSFCINSDKRIERVRGASLPLLMKSHPLVLPVGGRLPLSELLAGILAHMSAGGADAVLLRVQSIPIRSGDLVHVRGGDVVRDLH